MCLIHRVYWEVASLPITEHFTCIYGFNQASSASRVLPRLSGPSLQWANVLNPFLLMPQFSTTTIFKDLDIWGVPWQYSC